MRKVLLACSLFLAACGGSKAQAPAPEVAKVVVPEKVLTWNEPGPAALKSAQVQRKMMIIWFFDEHCPACTAMRGGALSDPCVVDELNEHFVFVGANVTKKPQLASFLDEPVFPSTMFVLPDETGTIIPTVLQGALPADKFCTALKAIHVEFEKELKKLDALERGH